MNYDSAFLFGNWNSALVAAAKEGSIEKINFALEKGATALNWAAESAAFDNHIEIVKFLIEKGANSYISIASISAYHGYLELLKLAGEYCDLGRDEIILEANRGGHLEVIKFLMTLRVYNWHDYWEMLRYAVMGNYFDVLDFMVEKGVFNQEQAMSVSKEYNNHPAMIEYLNSVQTKL